MTPCDTCTGKTRMVRGDGPQPCKYMAIGEAPGREEDRGGRPFIGPSGMELNENYLQLAGLYRQEVYFTNVRKCRPDNNRTPTEKEAMSCGMHHLPSEIQSVEPSVIFLLGSTACAWASRITANPIDLDADHGIPRLGQLFDWNGWLVPLYHPAAGMHETRMMTPQLEDWETLLGWLDEDQREQGGWQWPEDQYPKRDYILTDSSGAVHAYFDKYLDGQKLACVDTESHLGEHFSTQVSILPGTAVMVKKETPAHDTLLWYIREFDEISFHNAPADLPFVEPVRKYRDTMIEAYNLGNLPQGLKSLGMRICGVKMKSFLDVVTGPSRDRLLEWITEALSYEMQFPDVTIKQLKTKTKTTTKPNIREKLLWRVADYTMKNPEYDPWVRLRDVESSRMAKLIEVCGPMPELGIANVPVEDLIEYGCQDADIGLRVALDFEERRKKQMELWGIREEDRDQ